MTKETQTTNTDKAPASPLGKDADPIRHSVLNFIDEMRERRYLFWVKFFGKFTPQPNYLWNGGWDD